MRGMRVNHFTKVNRTCFKLAMELTNLYITAAEHIIYPISGWTADEVNLQINFK